MRLVESSEEGIEFCNFEIWLAFAFPTLSLITCSGFFALLAFFIRGSVPEDGELCSGLI